MGKTFAYVTQSVKVNPQDWGMTPIHPRMWNGLKGEKIDAIELEKGWYLSATLSTAFQTLKSRKSPRAGGESKCGPRYTAK
jgi:hypothetical protein